MKPLEYYDKPPSLSGMRHLGNHVMLQLRKHPSDAELTDRLASYAVSLGGCSVAFARRLEATRLRWLQRYDEALEILQQSEPCRLCEGDRFFRLAMTAQALAFCASPEPSDVKKAFEMMPRIRKDFPRSHDDLNSYRAQWLDGRLLVVKHGQTTGGQARKNLRSAARTRLTFAYKGFLRHPAASPADALAVLSDLLALPWLAGKTADEVDRHLNIKDPDVRPHLDAALKKLPVETRAAYKALREAANEALRDDTYQPLVIKCLDAFRDCLAELSWPPMAAWYRSHFGYAG